MLNASEARQILESTNGRIFSVLFTKRTNGEERRLVGRTGVTSHLRGGSLPYRPSDHNLFIVFDVQKGGYRAIPLDAIHEIRFGGRVYR